MLGCTSTGGWYRRGGGLPVRTYPPFYSGAIRVRFGVRFGSDSRPILPILDSSMRPICVGSGSEPAVRTVRTRARMVRVDPHSPPQTRPQRSSLTHKTHGHLPCTLTYLERSRPLERKLAIRRRLDTEPIGKQKPDRIRWTQSGLKGLR